jgi:hypothetical protein
MESEIIFACISNFPKQAMQWKPNHHGERRKKDQS